MKQPKSFRLSAEAAGILDRVDNTTKYIEAIVRARNQRVLRSLAVLRSAGWTGPEMLACCDVLNGWWQLCSIPRWHGASIADGTVYAEKWGIGPERWAELARQVSESESVAYALHEIVSEFWCGNTAIEEAIKK
jgi:hypothetical protein